MSRFINTELKSNSDSDSELDSEEESKFDAEFMAKLESSPDTFLLTLNKSFYCQWQHILNLFCLCLYFCGSNFLAKLFISSM